MFAAGLGLVVANGLGIAVIIGAADLVGGHEGGADETDRSGEDAGGEDIDGGIVLHVCGFGGVDSEFWAESVGVVFVEAGEGDAFQHGDALLGDAEGIGKGGLRGDGGFEAEELADVEADELGAEGGRVVGWNGSRDLGSDGIADGVFVEWLGGGHG